MKTRCAEGVHSKTVKINETLTDPTYCRDDTERLLLAEKKTRQDTERVLESTRLSLQNEKLEFQKYKE